MSQEIKSRRDVESVGRSITEFPSDAHVKSTVPKWFAHYEDLFTMDLMELVDKKKVRLLLRKLGSAEHDRYSNYILPKRPCDYNFAETVEILNKNLVSTLHYNIRFYFLNIRKRDTSTSWRMQAPSKKSVNSWIFHLSGMPFQVPGICMWAEVLRCCWGSKENSIKDRTEPRH